MAAQHGGGLDIGSIVKWGALIGGGYWLYTKVSTGSLFSALPGSTQPAPAPPAGSPPAGGTGTPPPAPPQPPPPAPTLAQALVSAATGDPALVNGMMNADKWNYYRNLLFPPALTGDQFVKAFPYVVSGDRNTQLSVDQFVAAIKGAGLGAVGFGALPARAHRVQLRDGKVGLVWVRTPGAVPWMPPRGAGFGR